MRAGPDHREAAGGVAAAGVHPQKRTLRAEEGSRSAGGGPSRDGRQASKADGHPAQTREQLSQASGWRQVGQFRRRSASRRHCAVRRRCSPREQRYTVGQRPAPGRCCAIRQRPTFGRCSYRRHFRLGRIFPLWPVEWWYALRRHARGAPLRFRRLRPFRRFGLVRRCRSPDGRKASRRGSIAGRFFKPGWGSHVGATRSALWRRGRIPVYGLRIWSTSGIPVRFRRPGTPAIRQWLSVPIWWIAGRRRAIRFNAFGIRAIMGIGHRGQSFRRHTFRRRSFPSVEVRSSASPRPRPKRSRQRSRAAPASPQALAGSRRARTALGASTAPHHGRSPPAWPDAGAAGRITSIEDRVFCCERHSHADRD